MSLSLSTKNVGIVVAYLKSIERRTVTYRHKKSYLLDTSGVPRKFFGRGGGGVFNKFS
jgi:hypothetical protein